MHPLKKTALTRATAVATACCGLLLGVPAAHAHKNHRHDHDSRMWAYAKVVRAEPIYREIRVSEPREICREEPVTERIVQRGRSDPGAMLLGAVVGGVIGHQFGGGHGKDIATAAGAVIGANHAAAATYREGRVTERTVYETHCETVRRVRTEREIDGYDVTYKYQGRLFQTWAPHDPGARIRVRVDVAAYPEAD